MKKILFLGDIVGSHGCRFVKSVIYDIKKKHGIDIVIANGENSADGNGITPLSADMLFDFADIITTGNHCFRRKEVYPLLESSDRIIRPANYPEDAPGKGYCIYDMGSSQLAVINLIGVIYTDQADNPFAAADRILSELRGRLNAPNILVDLHAETTSEKKALGQYLAGRVTAVIGTHTHVQTADETILPGGTAYITDAGMCGAELSVLGVRSDIVIKRMCSHIPEKFTESDNPAFLNGVVTEYDEKTGKALSISRLVIR
ncbi:MAG: TIGR00282 family metallophosphoesterase [Oscillospiraceae bacterium]|nr:TIGR00282 family metallophosphoesterase [Oscillospiraceae bacterium]